MEIPRDLTQAQGVLWAPVIQDKDSYTILHSFLGTG